jgi:hypothetical protein
LLVRSFLQRPQLAEADITPKKADSRFDPSAKTILHSLYARAREAEWELSAEVMHARGSLAQPMTDAEIALKLRDLAATGCPRCEADRVIDAVRRLDEADDVRELMRLVAVG